MSRLTVNRTVTFQTGPTYAKASVAIQFSNAAQGVRGGPTTSALRMAYLLGVSLDDHHRSLLRRCHLGWHPEANTAAH